MSALMLGVGETLAGYQIDGVIGSGGMGVVYEATQLSLNRTVALKVLAPHLSGDLVFRERFRREGMMQAAIEHHNVVTIYEAGESEAGLYLAMRLVRGSNLKDLVATGSLEPARAVAILGQVAGALDAAHRHGVVHRDVKPQNILVEDGNGFLADFGLTKATGQNTLTKTGAYVGTLDYVPPEQIRGEALTEASDLYAFGAVLYECLTGLVPFVRDSEAALLYAHLSDAVRPVSEVRPGLPVELDAVITKALAKEPDARYRTATAMVEAAAQALGVAPAEPLPGAVPAAEPSPTSRSSKTVIDAAPRIAAAPVPDLTTKPPFPWPLAAGASLLAVVGALVAFMLADTAKTVPPVLRVASSSGVRVSYPAGWMRASKAPAFAGLALAQPLVLRSGSRRRAVTLVAGTISSVGPTLLPAGLAAEIPAASRPGVATLAAGAAYRYAAVRPKGSPLVATIFAVPTSRGSALAACLAPPGADTSVCQAIAATMRVTSPKVVALGPSGAYAAALTATFGRLETARVAGRAALARAETRAAQKSSAGALRSAYAKASAAVASLTAPAGVAGLQAALASALARTGAAYGTLAAQTATVSGYDRARRAVALAEMSVTRALAALGAAGYTRG